MQLLVQVAAALRAPQPSRWLWPRWVERGQLRPSGQLHPQPGRAPGPEGASNGVVGDRIRPRSAPIPLLQCHVLLRHAERSPGGARGGQSAEPGGGGGLGDPAAGREKGSGASPRCCIAAPSREQSAEGSWEGRGCCIAGLRLEAVRVEMCRWQSGCDTGERHPAHPRIRSSFL